MKQADIGIIGGSGIGDALLKDMGGDTVHLETPFGPPSAPPIVAEWEGIRVAFIARHGLGHRFNPSMVPYRANIWAMKRLGVSAVIASGATGSLREDIEPAHLVICDQVIDRTFRRAGTYFDEGLAVHVELAEPFCPVLRDCLARAADRVKTTVHHAGTYVCMEGPQFSTRAESDMHRQWGGDLIGMTCMPEAKLAREAEICYAMIALPTDYDCWRSGPAERRSATDLDRGLGPARPAGVGTAARAEPPSSGPETLLAEILRNLKTASENAIALIHEALKLMKADPARGGGCRCGEALKLAIWSDRLRVDPVVRKRLEPLIGRYMTDIPSDAE